MEERLERLSKNGRAHTHITPYIYNRFRFFIIHCQQKIFLEYLFSFGNFKSQHLTKMTKSTFRGEQGAHEETWVHKLKVQYKLYCY